MQFFKNTNFNFIGKRKIALIVSGSLILIGLISLIIHKGPNLSIDFKGGNLIQVEFSKEVPLQSIRDALH
ncbi:MAG: protein translocase subunit SecF, partial [Deltaproteobacteria bacterium]